MKKFFRDAGILVLFCGVFYFMTVMVSRLDGDSGNDDSDLSPARKQADVFVQRKDWQSAKLEYIKLTEQDPLNGYAWDQYARSILELRMESISILRGLNRSDIRNNQRVNELDRQIDELSDEAREVLLRVKKFARYRSRALLRLAVIECYRGNNEEAMDFLEEFVGRGYQTSYGLERYHEFGTGGQLNPVELNTGPPQPPFSRARQPVVSTQFFETEPLTKLHLEPRFWDIVRRESEETQVF